MVQDTNSKKPTNEQRDIGRRTNNEAAGGFILNNVRIQSINQQGRKASIQGKLIPGVLSAHDSKIGLRFNTKLSLRTAKGHPEP